MQKDFETFLNLLIQATERVEGHYFQLLVAGSEAPIYRERVYCYELYHRMRECMSENFPYVLDGEVDKVAHPIRDELQVASARGERAVEAAVEGPCQPALEHALVQRCQPAIRPDPTALDQPGTE